MSKRPRLALHYLPDFRKVIALKRINGMIWPGGIFWLWNVIFNFEPEEIEERNDEFCFTLANDIKGNWIR